VTARAAQLAIAAVAAAAVGGGLGVLAAGGSPARPPASSPGPGSFARTVAAVQDQAGCRPAAVSYGPPPTLRGGVSAPPGVPWVTTARGRITGSLFYYSQPAFTGLTHAVIGVHGVAGHDVQTTILWTLAGPTRRLMEIRGRRLDAPGVFHQLVGGLGPFAAVIDIPAAGCWRVSLRDGRVAGSLVFQAVSLAG
jgi:hypothetical protein